MEVQGVQNYFSDLAFRFEITKKHIIETDLLLSSRFSVFNYINIDENRLSDIIADLLNPEGKHGQQNCFLYEFLKIINQSKLLGKNYPKVHREASTTHILRTQRRMDILLEWSNEFALMIENKPWAIDQDEQLLDYHRNLKHKSYKEGFLLIYLSNSELGPDNNSIEKEELDKLIENKQFLQISFENELMNWIKKCIEKCQSDKMRWFLKDFKTYLEKTFK